MVTNDSQSILSAQIPKSLRDDLRAKARVNDRSVSAETRRAITIYLRTGADADLRLEPPREGEVFAVLPRSEWQLGLDH
jgi:hypothetical protein